MNNRLSYLSNAVNNNNKQGKDTINQNNFDNKNHEVLELFLSDKE